LIEALGEISDQILAGRNSIWSLKGAFGNQFKATARGEPSAGAGPSIESDERIETRGVWTPMQKQIPYPLHVVFDHISHFTIVFCQVLDRQQEFLICSDL
jgi:hypothetical protein